MMSIPELLNPIGFNSIPNNGKSEQTIRTCPDLINPKASSKIEHILFLDYDDTILATTYLLSNIKLQIDEKTKSIDTFSINEKCNETVRKQFVANLEKSGQATFKLLTTILSKFKSANIKIGICKFAM